MFNNHFLINISVDRNWKSYLVVWHYGFGINFYFTFFTSLAIYEVLLWIFLLFLAEKELSDVMNVSLRGWNLMKLIGRLTFKNSVWVFLVWNVFPDFPINLKTRLTKHPDECESKNFNFNKNPDYCSFQTVKCAPINLEKSDNPKSIILRVGKEEKMY